MNVDSFFMTSHPPRHHAPPPAFVPLPRGWEQCLDLQAGVFFFKNLITGARTYTDPRLSDSSSSKACLLEDSAKMASKQVDTMESSMLQSVDRPGHLLPEHDSIGRSIDLNLRLSLNSPTLESHPISTLSSLANSDNTHPNAGRSKLPVHPDSSLSLTMSLSSTSMCSSSSSSPSVMSFQQDEEMESVEVESSHQKLFGLAWNGKQEVAAEAMTTAGCLRCLMYVLLSRRDPRCPQCGDKVLLNFPMPDDVPAPL